MPYPATLSLRSSVRPRRSVLFRNPLAPICLPAFFAAAGALGVGMAVAVETVALDLVSPQALVLGPAIGVLQGTPWLHLTAARRVPRRTARWPYLRFAFHCTSTPRFKADWIAAAVSDLRDSFSRLARTQRSKSSSSGFACARRTSKRSSGGLPRISILSICGRIPYADSAFTASYILSPALHCNWGRYSAK